MKLREGGGGERGHSGGGNAGVKLLSRSKSPSTRDRTRRWRVAGPRRVTSDVENAKNSEELVPSHTTRSRRIGLRSCRMSDITGAVKDIVAERRRQTPVAREIHAPTAHTRSDRNF